MRSRLFSSAPSLRIELSRDAHSRGTCCYYLWYRRYLTVLRYTYTAVPTVCSSGPPHDGTRQLDQVGWSEGGPHIVNQLTFVISVRERLQTHEN